MIEKSRSTISLRRNKTSFKARFEFGWSAERGKWMRIWRIVEARLAGENDSSCPGRGVHG